MKQYINQLIGDLDLHISDHHELESPGNTITIDTEYSEDLLELSRTYLSPSYSFAEMLNLEQHYLPPADRLSDREISTLYEKLSDALLVHRCYLDFPHDLNDRSKYDILRKNWDEPQMICKDSYNTIDFCDYDQDNCMYGSGNCQCKKYEDQG